LCITLAVLMALALLRIPRRMRRLTSALRGPTAAPARNWIGPTGPMARICFSQISGSAAFLLPAAILVLGWRWLRSQAIDSQVATLSGYGLLLLSLPALISLLPFIPAVRGAIPAGALMGGLASSGLLASLKWEPTLSRQRCS